MRRGEAIVNLALFFGPLLLAILITGALSLSSVRLPAMYVCAGLYAVGLSLLLTAKGSLFRQGIWISFGPSRMSSGNRRRYRAAYVLLVAGAVLNGMALISTVVPG